MVYVVIFDFKNKGDSHKEFLQAVSRCSSGKFFDFESACLMKSHMPIKELASYLEAHLDSNNDCLFVIEASKNYHGYLQEYEHFDAIDSLFD